MRERRVSPWQKRTGLNWYPLINPPVTSPRPLKKLAAGMLARGQGTDPAGCHRLGQDLYYGECHRQGEPSHPGAGPQQDAGRPALQRVPGVFPRTTRWNTLYPTTTTISPRPISPRPTPISKRTPPSTMRSKSCATRRPRPCPSGGMSSLWRAYPASTPWATPSTTATW